MDVNSNQYSLYLQVIVIVVVLVLVGVDDDVGHHAEPDDHRRQEVVRVESKGACPTGAVRWALELREVWYGKIND